MNEKDELQKLHEKEQEYEDLFEDFINSDEDSTFSKNEVKKIIEAHIFKEVLGSYKQRPKRSKSKNLLVTSKEIGLRIFNTHALVSFFISYLFYIGFLLLTNEFLYPNLFVYKTTAFIIAFGFTVIDKLVKPFIFVVELISFTIHKIGLITLVIFSVILYFASSYLGENVSFEKSFIVSLIALVCMAVIDFLKRDSLFKTKYIDDLDMKDGSDQDE